MYKTDEGLLQRKAIVIIDEIDAHLHPAWQQRIIGLLRDNFPNVQFILTAHSPLVVAGCYEKEVAVLKKNEDGSFGLHQFEHDFIGWETADLYEEVFKIEDEDYTYLKYATRHLFRKDIAQKIEKLEAIEKRTDTEENELDKLYREQYYISRYSDMREKRKKKENLEEENEALKQRIAELEAQIKS